MSPHLQFLPHVGRWLLWPGCIGLVVLVTVVVYAFSDDAVARRLRRERQAEWPSVWRRNP